jgi:hypothetical protein
MTSTNLKGLTVAANDGKARSDQLGGEIDLIDILAERDGQHRITADRVLDAIYADWAVFEGLGSDIASRIVERTLDRAIASLRRDRRFAEVSVTDLELIFADARREAEVEIARNLDDHVTMRDIRELGARGFPTDEAGS